MTTFDNVKVGDRVWVGQPNYRGGLDKRISLLTIVHVTPKRFSGSQPFQVYERKTGKPIGSNAHYALSIASLEEVQRWEAEQEAKRQAAEIQRLERECQTALNLALCSLFSPTLRAYIEVEDDAYNITFRGLTEQGIRNLAAVIAQIQKEIGE